MPINPIDYLTRNLPMRIHAAADKLRVVRDNMEQVNIAKDAYYADEMTDELDDILERLGRMSARLLRIETDVMADTRRYDEEKRAERQLAKNASPVSLQNVIRRRVADGS